MSEGEKQFLVTAQVGEGLLFAGQNHVTAQFVASQYEYDLITSKPQDILAHEEETPTAPQSESVPPQPAQNQPAPASQTDTDSGINIVETQPATQSPSAQTDPPPQPAPPNVTSGAEPLQAGGPSGPEAVTPNG